MTDRSFPLKWPDGWPRVTAGMRRAAPYKTSLDTAVKELVADLGRMGAKDVTISSNVRVTLGSKVSESEVRDPGVAVYWTHKDGSPRVMACDHWQRLRDNVRAVGLTIAAIRQIERCGATGLMDRALDGFKALPEALDCWQLLRVRHGASRDEVTSSFRQLAATHHPDRGGNPDAFAALTAAYHEALEASR